MITRAMQFLLFFLLFSTGSYAQQANTSSFILNGTIEGRDKGYIWLFYTNNKAVRITDSALIDNGKFTFRGNISIPTFSALSVMKAGKNNDLTLFLEPGKMTVAVALNHFDKATVTGSVTQQQLELTLARKAELAKQYQPQLDSLNAAHDDKQRAAIRERLEPYLEAYDWIDITYVARNPRSFLSAYLLNIYQRELTIDTAEMYFSRLTEEAKASPFGKSMLKKFAERRSGEIGQPAYVFNTTDIKNEKLGLENFRGKYVLLDFWASWCIPCRAANPHLKELYAKYKAKGVEFIGIADDYATQADWKKAVKDDGIGIWKQVLSGANNDEKLSAKYAVPSYPTKILISPAGIIIGRYGEEGNELDKKLAELFN